MNARNLINLLLIATVGILPMSVSIHGALHHVELEIEHTSECLEASRGSQGQIHASLHAPHANCPFHTTNQLRLNYGSRRGIGLSVPERAILPTHPGLFHTAHAELLPFSSRAPPA